MKKICLWKCTKSSKRILTMVLTICFIMGNVTILMASIGNSVHNPSPDQCIVCHAKNSEKGQIPMWETLAEGAIQNSIKIQKTPESETRKHYDSPTFDMNYDNQSQSKSSFCLICHNGVFSSLVNYRNPDSNAKQEYDYVSNPSFWAAIDSDLSNDHPIGFVYNPKTDLDNNGFPDVTSMQGDSSRKAIRGKRTGTYYPLYGSNNDHFECLTCHVAHYDGNHNIKDKYREKLLRADNKYSSMCIDCHVNKY